MNIFSKKPIYLDYAALTPTDPRVLLTMQKYYDAAYGNPASIHSYGIRSIKAIEQAKESISKNLSIHPDEIMFTGSGTEANHIALSFLKKGDHVIISEIEHSSILNSLDEADFTVDHIKVNKDGIVDLEELKAKIKKETKLVSIQWVNNEIGTIQPIKEIGKIVRNANGPLFHCDASQAPVCIDIDIRKYDIDMLTLDGHKMYGPKGVGMLYVKRGVEKITNHSGTPNVPGIMGFARALDLVTLERSKNLQHFELLSKEITSHFKTIHGSPRIPSIVNVEIPNTDSEYLTIQLDAKGFAISTKSSCLRDEDESYVLRAIGASSKNSIRISIGTMTTIREVKDFLKTIITLID